MHSLFLVALRFAIRDSDNLGEPHQGGPQVAAFPLPERLLQ